MICSTMHCYEKAEEDVVTVNGKWWEIIKNPAPFCKKCKEKNRVQSN